MTPEQWQKVEDVLQGALDRAPQDRDSFLDEACAGDAQLREEATSLVNEAYIRLAGAQNVAWQNRAHFFAVTAQVMRHILIDHARRRNVADVAAARGGAVGAR